VLIEQAIFTSVQTSTAAGYQLAATSPGISEADARELTAWGPSHDSLWEAGPAAASVNFFRLPSGSYCISQTEPAGAEYSQRRGLQIYTQCLVATAKDLAQFANNPLALLQAAVALGHVHVHEKIPKRLEPFSLVADGALIDRAWLAQLVRHPGPVWLGALLHTALASQAVGIVAGDRGPSLVAALINCLPVECRTEFSFSTGLRYSQRRPFRVICLPNARADNQRLQRQQLLTLLDLKSQPPTGQLDGWAGFVSAMVHSGNSDYLADVLAIERPELAISQLDALGNESIQKLPAWRAARAASATKNPQADNSRSADATKAAPAALATGPSSTGPLPSADPWQRADGSHVRSGIVSLAMAAQAAGDPAGAMGALEIDETPSAELSRRAPAARKALERLEDAIFETLAGKRQARNELHSLWLEVVTRVGGSLVDAARQEYLRYTLSLWRQVASSNGMRNAACADQALEIICLLIETPK
jgi:hypothetical protein